MNEDHRLRILLLSAGSMVGLNVLDALEGRRDRVRLIGADSSARNPQSYRCDRVYRVPPTGDGAAFTERIMGILRAEDPHLVLAGRDDDALAMVGWREAHPEWAGRLTCGSSGAFALMRDKLRSFTFARSRGLPFADSATGEMGAANPALEALIAAHGFPLVAKPRVGCGSRGVYLVHDRRQVEALLARGGYLFQEYLDPSPGLADALRELAWGTPLFFSLPDEHQAACQTAIAPDGQVGEIFCSRVRMVGGNPVASERVADAELEGLGRAFAEGLAAEGWAGPFNLQAKRRRQGGFAVFEMNGRMTGSTSARLRLGFDEVGTLARIFVGPDRLPAPAPPAVEPRWVIRSSMDAPLAPGDVRDLEEKGRWDRSS